MNKMVIMMYVIQALIHLIVCVFFACKCFENQLRFKKRTVMVMAGIYIVISVLIIELFLERIAPFGQYSKIAGIAWTIISVSFCFAGIKTNALYGVFLVFFIMNVSVKSMYVSNILYNLNIIPMKEIYYILISIGVWFCSIPFMWYLILGLFKKLVNLKNVDSYLKWLFILPFAYFMFYALVSKNFFRDISWRGLMVVLISNLTAYLSYVAVMTMFLKMNESLARDAKVQLFEQLIVVQNEQYDKVKESMEQIYRIKHDFRHNLIVMKIFVMNKDLQGLEEYLDICDDFKLDVGLYNTNNNFVDILLSHYTSIAKSEDVDIRVFVQFPEEFEFPNNEIVVLFGNLLENAIESCRRQTHGDKFIEIKTKTISNSMIAIKVTNSYSGKIVKNGDGFVSSKGKGLGVGTSTIRFISEKNGGNCEFSYDNETFRACVLLITA